MNWDEFRSGVSPRFFPPLSYIFRLDFVEVEFTDSQKAVLSQQLTLAVIEAIKADPFSNLAHLKFRRDSGTVLSLDYTPPVYNFGFRIDADSIHIAKTNCTAEEYIWSLTILQSLANQLFGTNTKYSLTQHDFFGHAYRASHAFQHSLLLGPRLTNESEACTNMEIMQSFANLSPTASTMAELQADSVLCADVEYSIVKNLGGRPANVWLTAKAPYSPTRRDLVLNWELRRGEAAAGAKLQQEDLFEFTAIAQFFYRDVIVRIFQRLFQDCTIGVRNIAP